MTNSPDQQLAIDYALQGNNVRVCALAGCGKTHCAIETATKLYASKGFTTLILTYNTSLKISGRKKISSIGAEDIISVHSFHSAAGLFVNEISGSDDDIEEAMHNVPLVPLEYSMIVIDEAQDLTPLLYDFTLHIIRSIKSARSSPQIMIMGDTFQCIFGYNGATSKYLEDPDTYYGTEFKRVNLNITRRFGSGISSWVNSNFNPNNLCHAYPEWWKIHGANVCLDWASGIQTETSGGQVIETHGFNDTCDRLNKAIEYFYTCKTNSAPITVGIIGYSLKTHKDLFSYVRSTCHNVDWFIDVGASRSDDAISGDNALVRNNKITITTIHKSKGCEYDIVVMIGASANPESWHDNYLTPLAMFNVFYVGATRAKQVLIFEHDIKNEPYATIRKAYIPRRITKQGMVTYVNFKDYISRIRNKQDIVNRVANITVIDACVLGTKPIPHTPHKLIRGRSHDVFESFYKYVPDTVKACMCDTMYTGEWKPYYVKQVSSEPHITLNMNSLHVTQYVFVNGLIDQARKMLVYIASLYNSPNYTIGNEIHAKMTANTYLNGSVDLLMNDKEGKKCLVDRRVYGDKLNPAWVLESIMAQISLKNQASYIMMVQSGTLFKIDLKCSIDEFMNKIGE